MWGHILDIGNPLTGTIIALIPAILLSNFGIIPWTHQYGMLYGVM